MHNGLKTQEAIQGTFTRAGFLLVGTEESPCPYSATEPRRDAYGGKQFAIAATKTGKHPTRDFFDPSFKPLFEGDEWAERLPYRELQPEKPDKGFLTSDYSKRDEFSMTIRMEQHRQQIKHEARVQKLAEERLAARSPPKSSGEKAAQLKGGSARRAVPLLFDMVFNGDSALCPKARRDTCNPTLLSTERDVGPLRTTMRLMHAPPTAVQLSQSGDRQAVGAKSGC